MICIGVVGDEVPRQRGVVPSRGGVAIRDSGADALRLNNTKRDHRAVATMATARLHRVHRDGRVCKGVLEVYLRPVMLLEC